MGIHNEPGNQRLKPLPKLSKLIDQMLAMLTSTTDKERSFVPFQNDGNDEVVLLVNNLGAISELEMGAIAGEGEPQRHPNADQPPIMPTLDRVQSGFVAQESQFQNSTRARWNLYGAKLAGPDIRSHYLNNSSVSPHRLL